MRTFGPLGEGKLTVEWGKIAEVGAAQLFRAAKITLEEDIVDTTVSSLDIPALAKGFRIPRRILEASRTFGTPLDVATAKSASYEVSLLEDTLVLNTSGGFSGLYASAGNTVGGGDWGTATNILTNCNSAVGELTTDKIFPPYNLVLHPDQYVQTLAVVSGTATTYRELVQKIIGGEVYQSPTLTAGTGMMTAPPDAGFFDLVLGVDVHAEVEELPLDQFKDLYGVVWEAVVPRIHQANAICTLTGI
jgi:uncharacterized linocin/CFP29 family protein